jgi:hypothetical protein
MWKKINATVIAHTGGGYQPGNRTSGAAGSKKYPLEKGDDPRDDSRSQAPSPDGRIHLEKDLFSGG